MARSKAGKKGWVKILYRLKSMGKYYNFILNEMKGGYGISQ